MFLFVGMLLNFYVCCHKLSECATANNDTCGQAKNAASNNAFLQLLTLWCKDFYEDDFESDAVFRYEMGYGKLLVQFDCCCRVH